jgi:hypothetical protein
MFTKSDMVRQMYDTSYMKCKQDRQCTYKIKLRRVRVTVVTVQQLEVIYILCTCSLSYPAFKVHAPYYIVVYGLSGSTIFFHVIS